MKQRIAIMGGTFNPIHHGHLLVAEYVLEQMNLNKVIFMPSGNPPHKDIDDKNKEDRYFMTKLATENNERFEVSRREIDRHGPSYTIDTLKNIINDYPDAEIFFIIGYDIIKEILNWNRSQELFSLCNFIVVNRPDENNTEVTNYLRKIKETYSPKIFVLQIPALNISSTDIRNKIKLGQSIKNLVPENVEAYINKKQMYRGKYTSIISDVLALLSSELSEKRKVHSIGVANTAVSIAKKYDADIEKSYIAGLLHDIAKEYPKEKKFKLCKIYKIEPDEIMCTQIDLAHQFLSAKLAEDKLHINDSEILNAISYHTTGRKNMSLLEKIIFLADCIEPNRSYNSVDALRKLAYENLDRALAICLQEIILFNNLKQRLIHPLSLQAYDFYRHHLEN